MMIQVKALPLSALLYLKVDKVDVTQSKVRDRGVCRPRIRASLHGTRRQEAPVLAWCSVPAATHTPIRSPVTPTLPRVKLLVTPPGTASRSFSWQPFRYCISNSGCFQVCVSSREFSFSLWIASGWPCHPQCSVPWQLEDPLQPAYPLLG